LEKNEWVDPLEKVLYDRIYTVPLRSFVEAVCLGKLAFGLRKDGSTLRPLSCGSKSKSEQRTDSWSDELRLSDLLS
jgi:hypothetical protein